MVVPQKIVLHENATGDIELFCRSAKQERNVAMSILDGSVSLSRRRLPVMRPSEMSVIKMPEEALARMKSGQITLAVEHSAE